MDMKRAQKNYINRGGYFWPRMWGDRTKAPYNDQAERFEEITDQFYPNEDEWNAGAYIRPNIWKNSALADMNEQEKEHQHVQPNVHFQGTVQPEFRERMQLRTDELLAKQTPPVSLTLMGLAVGLILAVVFLVAGAGYLNQDSPNGGKGLEPTEAPQDQAPLVVTAPTAIPRAETPAEFSILVSPGAKLKFIRGGVTATVTGGDQSIAVAENDATYFDPQGGLLSVKGISFGTMRQDENGVLITFSSGTPIRLVLYKVPVTEKPVYFFVANPEMRSVGVRAHTDNTFYLEVDQVPIQPNPSIGTPIEIGKENTIAIATSNGPRTEEMYVTFPEILP